MATHSNRPPKGENRRNLLLLLLNTLLCFVIYRTLLFYAEMTDKTFGAFLVMVIYMALLLGFTLAYLIYNRFLWRKGIRPEQLPAEWSTEQKCAFLEDGERRLRRSRWMMLIIIPLLFTFLMDTLELFILEPLFRR